MTTLPPAARTSKPIQQQKQEDVHSGDERREFRRFDMDPHAIRLDRWNGTQQASASLGEVIDLSAGGVRVRTKGSPNLKRDAQIRIRLELPVYSAICPFVDTTGGQPTGKREWVGWMAVSRVHPVGEGQYDVAGRLLDMQEIDRGMLGLYLSTQPLAA